MVNQDIAQHFLVANSIHQTKKSQPSSKDLAPDEREWLFDNTRGACKNALVMERFLDQFGRVISAACVSQYKGMRSLENIGSRGRRGLLTGKESSLVLQAFDKMREQAVPVYAALVASVARGIKEQSSPKSTSLKGGPLKFSLSWAKDWMKQNNIRVRHATSDRTVTPNEVVEASKTFFSQLESYKNRCEKELVFNTDEFFVCLGLGQANATWTWERINPGESRTISVRREKQGFTCNVLSSAAGEIKMLQFIFQGTSRVFVNVGSDPRALQCARKGSHFQDASTWATFLSRFKEILASEREAMKKPAAPALLIIDEATQHSGTDEILLGSSCDVVRIPKKMTHVFQPADQFVISGLKTTRYSALQR